jgi:3-oxoacyl-[acyl-carrier protein] reductase
MRLKDRIAIVTGGGQGIGRAICLALAKEGCDLVIGDINIQTAEKVAEEIKSLHRRSLAVKVDVCDSRQVNQMVKTTLKEFGRVDILVNNAGIAYQGTIEDMKEEDWNKVIDVNLKGTFLCSKAVIKSMKRQRLGKIINMASFSGKIGGLTVGANYAASKAGIICFTKSLAMELAPYNVNVNAVSPAFIDTTMSTTFPKIPIGRKGLPEDVANAVVFLASEDASYITAEILDVDGGMSKD